MENEKKPQTTTTEEEVREDLEVINGEISNIITSPYLDYDHLEDFKMKAYGAKGHQEPKPGLREGATDAPTPSGGVGRGGGAASSDLSSTGAINRQGVP